MDIIIKDALPVDVDQILPLLSQRSDFDVQDQTRGLRLMLDGCGKHRTVKVACADDAVVGICTAQARISMVHGNINAVVEDLLVDRGHKNKGVSALLLSAIEEWAENKGIKSISLLVDKNDQERIDFYNTQAWESTPLICLVKSLD
nr:GNAT family N-acetyltransferase [uncultured Desulfobacter sp.]